MYSIKNFNIISWLKALFAPLCILVISIALIILTSLYLVPYSNNLASILNTIWTGLLVGVIIYVITVTFPSQRQKQIAKFFAIDNYIAIKENMIASLLRFINKYDREVVEQSLRSYLPLREYITRQDWYDLQNNLTEEFVRENVYYLGQLKEILETLLDYDFVKSNEVLYKRIGFLKYWVNQFLYYCNPAYVNNNHYDISKDFAKFLWEHLCGANGITKARDNDDFLELLENS
ncbi:MAG: hypothetical protein K0Q57_918 [Gammaproteobacteria bacterium]|jgi:hypothetical protein|nr:hypothetical protein [Gammaproteobacteria bacterium]